MMSSENVDLWTSNLVLFWKPSRLPGGKIYYKGTPRGSKVCKKVPIRKEEYLDLQKKVPQSPQRKDDAIKFLDSLEVGQ